MSKMLLLTDDFPPHTGGVARYLGQFAHFFRARIRVIAAPCEGSETFDRSASYAITRRDLYANAGWPRWWKAILILIQERKTYDTLVVSHVLPFGVAAHAARALTFKPYIVIVHGMDVSMAKRNPWKKRLAGHVMRTAKLVVTNSKALEYEVREEFGVKKTIVAYPCIDAIPNLSLKRRGNEGEVRFLTVSRLVPRKGHVRILEALARLRDEGLSFSYTIVGDGPMAGAIRACAAKFDLVECVSFWPQATDQELDRLYDQADVFVMPTVAGSVDREGFGLVYLEAAAHGVPSIATDQPGVDEAVIDGKTGLLVKDGDIDALADAIRRLATDEVFRLNLGSAARGRAISAFTCDIQFGKLQSIL